MNKGSVPASLNRPKLTNNVQRLSSGIYCRDDPMDDEKMVGVIGEQYEKNMACFNRLAGDHDAGGVWDHKQRYIK